MSSLAGHLGPLIGGVFENDVKKLLGLLGYSILRENVIQPSIDKVIRFTGESRPKQKYIASLEQPYFSPNNIVAVSIKKGVFGNTEVTELLRHIEEAKNNEEDFTLQNIEGGIIISNIMKLPSEIDNILERSIYCWDICRLFSSCFEVLFDSRRNRQFI